jgi:hypothetical protein
MLFSTSLLKNSVEKYQKSRKEKYTYKESANAGFTASFTSFMLVLSLVFFTFEFILLFFAISIAVNCTTGGYERIVHLVLAVTFTLPYMLVASFFSDCGKTILKVGGIKSKK